MAGNLRINREHSALADGTLFGKKRRRVNHWVLGIWLLGLFGVGMVMLNFDRIQPVALAMVGQAPTATPEDVTYAQRGYGAYLHGDLEIAIDNYCSAAHGVPTSAFASPRCKLPADNSDAANNIDVNIGYELIRVLVYRSYDDRRLGIYQQDAENWGKLLVAIAPNNARAHAIYCYALTNNNHAEQGVPEGLSAVTLAPNDGDAHAYLSMAYNSSDRYQDALAEGEKAVALSGQSVDAHLAAADAAFITANYDEAQNQYEAATKINPRLTLPYFELAGFFVNRNQQEAAIAEYDQVLAMDNKNVKAYTRKCATYFNIGVNDKALASCQNATTLDPNYTEAWKWQGQVLYNRRDYEDAITAFTTCKNQETDAVKKGEIASSDRLPECWYLLGLTYYLLSQCDKAYPLFNEVLTFTTSDVAIRLTRKGIEGCSSLNPNTPTPTPLPTVAAPPAPILS